ncbi:hypothetical protein [Scytonema millei]|uniref:Uncharacterized protein n=1 Tax=Scytonema millei VB511283 TaxID=1245923 RepID=A0A9X5I915_9CYAN|nr:hypothetical protein [Scytonema millei]NHC38207.1 hypothetical protein [Scytonema millei VB511283]
MNLQKKISVMAAASIVGIFGIASNAMAGEGGAAGSAAFTINATTSKVDSVAVAAAVGKNSAFAGAASLPSFGMNVAVSLGSASQIDPTFNLSSGTIVIDDNTDTQISSSQNNNLDSPHAVKIGSASGDEVVDFGDNVVPE